MEKNCDPMFYEIVDITIDATQDEPLPPFIFDVYDEDKQMISSPSYDFMGRALFFPTPEECAIVEIDEGEDAAAGFKPPDPIWHDLRVSQDAPPQGKILLSFVKCKEYDMKWAQ